MTYHYREQTDNEPTAEGGRLSRWLDNHPSIRTLGVVILAAVTVLLVTPISPFPFMRGMYAGTMLAVALIFFFVALLKRAI